MNVSFNDLRKASQSFTIGKLKIVVVGDCATQFLVMSIKGALAIKGISGEIFEAEYNQVERQLLSADSILKQINPDIVVVWECVEHWWADGISYQSKLSSVENYAKAIQGKLIYINSAPFHDGIFGSYPADGRSFSAQIRAFNSGLDSLVMKIPNLFITDLNSIVAEIGRDNTYDAPTYMLSDMPLSPDAQGILGMSIAEIISAMEGRIHKCIVVDLDNTLWGGIIGEDGLSGIQIGEYGIGKAFSQIQRYLKRLKERGVLLAVCSKNDETIAKVVFEKHPDMILKLDDFVCFVANWQTKADNIAHIQKVLNIGFDSIVFLDDNPVEREIVRIAHPQVAVPELPQDPSVWIDYLACENLFETVSYSENDVERTHQYQNEAKRREFEASFKDEKEFLHSLEMKSTCKLLDDFSISRAAQLSQRSNQFNLRTVRYTEADLKEYSKNDKIVQLGFTLEDRFGSHGLVSVIIAKQISSDTMFIDTWFMSCRVLMRGLEYFALNKLVEVARNRGISKLVGEYIPTIKNSMVATLLTKLGFSPAGTNIFELNINNFTNMETQINEK